MNNQGSVALIIDGVARFFHGIEPLGTYELLAIDFFDSWENTDIEQLLRHVDEDDMPDILVEVAKFGETYKEISHFRVFPSSMQDSYQVELKKGRGASSDITYKAPISKRRYLIGVHGKKR